MEQLIRIDVDRDRETGKITDFTYYFRDVDNPEEPFGIEEFTPGSPTRKRLEAIEELIGACDGNLANLSDLESGACGFDPHHAHQVEYAGCHSDRDGDCVWEECPQIRDGEPGRSGRHCPRDNWKDEEF